MQALTYTCTTAYSKTVYLAQHMEVLFMMHIITHSSLKHQCSSTAAVVVRHIMEVEYIKGIVLEETVL